VINRELGVGIGLAITFNIEMLPNLVQWKMPGQGTYVMGIEPANCLVEGRPAERERGTLVELEPGERRTYDLRFETYWGPDAIDDLVDQIGALG
jgi:hypothetical protein